MSKNLIAANVLLLVVAGLLGWQLHGSIKRFNAENDISRIQPFRDVKTIPVDQGLAPAKPPRQYNAGEFDVIPAQNLFSETRAREEKAEAAAAAAPETPPLDVKPVLVGITITGPQRYALIIDPSSTATGRKTQRRKLGDSYRGYTITDIDDNKMVLQHGNRREVIPLFDGSKHPTSGGKTAILATRVVSFGTGGSGSGGGLGVVAAAAPPGQVPARVAATGQPQAGVNTVVGASQAAAQQGGQSGVARGTPQQQTTRQTPGASGASPAWNERTDDQGRRVIRTPFGDIVRPEKPNNP